MSNQTDPPKQNTVRTDRVGLLLDQLNDAVTFSRNRLEGIEDHEFGWAPVEPAWSIRPRRAAQTPDAFGPGDHLLDLDRSIPVFAPGPMSTIAWRIGHLTSTFAGRWEYTFGDATADPLAVVDFSPVAQAMLDELWRQISRWAAAVEALTDDALDTIGLSQYPLGLDQTLPFVAMVRWQNSEAIHHLAEVALLRDLYKATNGAQLR